MATEHYHVVSESTEDRYGSFETLELAENKVKELLTKNLAESPLTILHRGYAVRQFSVNPNQEILEMIGPNSFSEKIGA